MARAPGPFLYWKKLQIFAPGVFDVDPAGLTSCSPSRRAHKPNQNDWRRPQAANFRADSEVLVDAGMGKRGD